MINKEQKLEWLKCNGFDLYEKDGMWVVEDIVDEDGYSRTFLTREGAISLAYGELLEIEKEVDELYTINKEEVKSSLDFYGYTITFICFIILGIIIHLQVSS